MADLEDWHSDDGDFGDVSALAEASVPEPPSEQNVTLEQNVAPEQGVAPERKVASQQKQPIAPSPPKENAWMSKKSGDARSVLREGSAVEVRGVQGRSGGDARQFRSGGSAGGDRWGTRNTGRRGGMSDMGGSSSGGRGGGRGREFTVFVGNIAPRVTERDILDLVFSGCNVKEARWPRISQDAHSKVAFVEMKDEVSFRRGLQKDGFVLEGRSLRINPEEGSSRDRNRNSGGVGGSYGSINYGGAFGSRERERERRAYGPNSRRSSGYGGGGPGGGGPIGAGAGRYGQSPHSSGGPGQFQGSGWQSRSSATPPSVSPAGTSGSRSESDDAPMGSGRPKLKLKPRTKPIPKPGTPKTPAEGSAYLRQRVDNRTSPGSPTTSSETPPTASSAEKGTARKPLRLNPSSRTVKKSAPQDTQVVAHGPTDSNASRNSDPNIANGTERKTNAANNFVTKKSRGSNARSHVGQKQENEKREVVEFANSFAALELEDTDE